MNPKIYSGPAEHAVNGGAIIAPCAADDEHRKAAMLGPGTSSCCVVVEAALPFSIQQDRRATASKREKLPWLGRPRPSSRSASASRSTAICRPSSEQTARASLRSRHLTAVVLGSAAGGGYPQWNCRCDVCRLAWEGDPRVQPRTQASVAVSADGEHWTILNAAPDLRTQLERTPALQPKRGVRGSPISAVVLTGGEVDQIAGLLTLREGEEFALYATGEILSLIEANSMFAVLRPDLVSRIAVKPEQSFALPGGLQATLFCVPGKPPLYAEGEAPQIGGETEASVGIEIAAGDRGLAFVPGAAAVTPALADRLSNADAILFDGTLFTDDEMLRSKTGTKTGRRMGHVPIDGAEGSLQRLAGLGGRRIYIHINNTNPVLVAGSPERRKVEAAGWEIAEDGMEIAL